MILVDALRSDYLTPMKMPFLHSKLISSIYVKSVKPSFGYCERTEIFTGMYPDKSGNFTALGFDPQNSEYRNFKCILKIAYRIMKGLGEKNTISKQIKRFIHSFLRPFGFKMHPYDIPFDLLYKFRLTEDEHSHYSENAFVKESIFDVLKRNDKKVYCNSFTALGLKSTLLSDSERVCDVISKLNEGYDLILLYIGEIDAKGHLYTGDDEIMIESLSRVDKYIEDILVEDKKNGGDNTIVVIGDHGMVEVNSYIDIKEQCDSLTIVRSKDYDYFLDSTIARFWFYNSESRDCITELLNENDFKIKGFILDNQKAIDYKVPINLLNGDGQNLYGDIIWCANPGVVISPDYFNSNKIIKGMHGYANVNNKESQGLLVITNQVEAKEIQQCNLIDVCSTLCDLIDIEYPNGNEGKSIYENI